MVYIQFYYKYAEKGEPQKLKLCFTGTNGDQYFLQIQSQDPGILDADKQVELVTEPYTDVAMAQFNITGVFLGNMILRNLILLKNT